MKGQKAVRVVCKIPAAHAARLKALALEDSASYPRKLDNVLVWLANQACQLGTINPLLPLAKINEAFGNVGLKWRGDA